MDQFPSNSQKARAQDEPRKLEQVTSAETVRRKQGLGQKFKNVFIGGSMRMAVDYMIMDVVVPAIQDTMIDAFQGGIERVIRGEGARNRRPSGGMSMGYSNAPHVNYQGMSSRPTMSSKPSTPTRMLSNQARARRNFDTLIIPNRPEAEEVIDRMFDILSADAVVTVADLYSLTGVRINHTDMKWGWTQLRGARALRRNDGRYILDLPEPEPLG